MHASAPLQGGTLTRLDGSDELANLIRPGTRAAAACLAAIASCPGITKVLLSTSNAAHWHSACRTRPAASADRHFAERPRCTRRPLTPPTSGA